MKKNLLLCLIALFGITEGASAAWKEILKVRFPANGTYRTTRDIRTSFLKVEKRGPDCNFVRINYSLYGRSYSGWSVLLNMVPQGQTSTGGYVHQVVPNATIFNISMISTAGSYRDRCTYTFYARTWDF